MKIYIAGPMTGYPDENFPAFAATQSRIEAAGHEALNPASHGHSEPGKGRPYFMRRDIPMVLEADAMALLPGWAGSIGARLEKQIADVLEIPLLNHNTLEPLGK